MRIFHYAYSVVLQYHEKVDYSKKICSYYMTVK